MNCRSCSARLDLIMADLGTAPFSNAYLTVEQLNEPELWYPLRVLVCSNCWLAQTEDFARRDELFSDDYAYFSSYSASWLVHAQEFARRMIHDLDLGSSSFVVEVASNDGYLLKEFVAASISCLGIEPTASTAEASRAIGVPVAQEFFGEDTALRLREQYGQADLIVANNVLAHVPDINDFLRGFAILLAENGLATFEFPHLIKLVTGMQLDTIYHEHFSYLSLTAAVDIFLKNGLEIVKVEELETHGGSLRLFVQLFGGNQKKEESVNRLLDLENNAGVRSTVFYESFFQRCAQMRHEFLDGLLSMKKEGCRIAAYGAAAKGNTLLNYAGVRRDLIEFIVDKNPAKQGKFMPGSRIPIVDESWLQATKPDVVVILPWNLEGEITRQLKAMNLEKTRILTSKDLLISDLRH
jgi:SAM-dependent methyltransferase